jgi:hypothetical protein
MKLSIWQFVLYSSAVFYSQVLGFGVGLFLVALLPAAI